MNDRQTEKTVFWHRELPPLGATAIGEHTVEATSAHAPGALLHRDELWDRCYRDLMDRTHQRIEQEIARLGGDYARVLSEAIEPRRNEVTDEAWLHGQFTYQLYSLHVS